MRLSETIYQTASHSDLSVFRPTADYHRLLVILCQTGRADVAKKMLSKADVDFGAKLLAEAHLSLACGDLETASEALCQVSRDEAGLESFSRKNLVSALLARCEENADLGGRVVAACALRILEEKPDWLRARRLAVTVHARLGLTSSALGAASEGDDEKRKAKLLVLCWQESRGGNQPETARQAAEMLASLPRLDAKPFTKIAADAVRWKDSIVFEALSRSSWVTENERAVLAVCRELLCPGGGDLRPLFRKIPEGEQFGPLSKADLIKAVLDFARQRLAEGDIENAASWLEVLLENAPQERQVLLFAAGLYGKQGAEGRLNPQWLHDWEVLSKFTSAAIAGGHLKAASSVLMAAPQSDDELQPLLRDLADAYVASEAGGEVLNLPVQARLDSFNKVLVYLNWLLTGNDAAEFGKSFHTACALLEVDPRLKSAAGKSFFSELSALAGKARAKKAESGRNEWWSPVPGPAISCIELLQTPLCANSREKLNRDAGEPGADLLATAMEVALEAGNPDAAGVFLGALRSVSPEHVHRDLNIARCEAKLLLARGNPIAAEMLLAARSVATAHPLRIRAAMESGEHLTAMARSMLRMKEHPDDFQNTLQVGLNLRAAGLEREAAALLESSAIDAEQQMFTWLKAVEAEARSDVRLLWEEAHRKFPDSVRIAVDFAKALIHDLEYRQGFELLQAMLNEKDQAAYARGICHLHYHAGNWKEWRKLAEDNRKHYPEIPGTISDLIYCLIEYREWERIDELVERLPDGVASASVVTRAKAESFAVRRRFREAISCLRAMPEPLSAEDEFRIGTWLLAEGALEEGLSHLEATRHRFPGEARIPIRIAQVSERSERHLEALESWRAASFQSPANPAVISGIARSSVFLGRPVRFEETPERNLGQSWAGARNDLLKAWELWSGKGLHAAAGAFAKARSSILARTSEIQRHAKERPEQVFFKGRWIPHPNALNEAANRGFWGLIERIQRGERVVVVGNSPSLRGSKLGKQIDSFDIVIRLNDFELEGYQKDAGSKVSVWFSSANRNARKRGRKLGSSQILLRQTSGLHFPDLNEYGRTRLGLNDASCAFYLPPAIFELMESLVYPSPSTGFAMILILMSLTTMPIHLAGFDFFFENTDYYFQTSKRLPVVEVHATRFENEFVLGLLKDLGVVQILRPAS